MSSCVWVCVEVYVCEMKYVYEWCVSAYMELCEGRIWVYVVCVGGYGVCGSVCEWWGECMCK